MNQIEKDKLVAEWMEMVMKLGQLENNPFNGFTVIRETGEFIERVYNKGREDGFIDGFHEGKRQAEKKYSKLN